MKGMQANLRPTAGESMFTNVPWQLLLGGGQVAVLASIRLASGASLHTAGMLRNPGGLLACFYNTFAITDKHAGSA